MYDARSGALSAIRTRIGSVLPRHLNDVEALEIAMAASLRRRSEVLHTLYGRSISRYFDQDNCARASIAPLELGCLVGVNAPRSDGLATGALEREDGVHGAAVQALGAALQTTLGPARCREAWDNPTTRCASVIAARMENPKEVLEAIFGPIPKVDVRRLGTTTEDLTCDEDESDEYILSTCNAVRQLARAIVA